MNGWRLIGMPVLVGIAIGVAAAYRTEAATGGNRSSVDGTVLDLVHRSPIANARVEVKCYKTQLHGSREIDRFEAMTGDRGVFAIRTSKLEKCDSLVAFASKDGYQSGGAEVRSAFEDSQALPRTLYLTRLDEVTMRNLRHLQGMTRLVHAEPKFEYMMVFSSFRCSIEIAKTADEVAFVKEYYCPRLQNLAARDPAVVVEGSALVPCLFAPAATNERLTARAVTSFCASR